MILLKADFEPDTFTSFDEICAKFLKDEKVTFALIDGTVVARW